MEERIRREVFQHQLMAIHPIPKGKGLLATKRINELKKQRKMKKTKSYKKLVKAILPLAKEITKLNKQAEELGLFLNDRELYECQKCGWMEDVECEGRLFSTFRDMPEIKNYHFRAIQNKGSKYYQCPICREVLK